METGCLPPLLAAGEIRASWESKRRGELCSLLAREVYGVTPPRGSYQTRFSAGARERATLPGGAASAWRTRVHVEIEGPRGRHGFPVDVFLPEREPGEPLPVILFLYNGEGEYPRASFWPAERLLARGYAAAILRAGAVSPDRPGGPGEGLPRCFESCPRPDEAMATIGAWAFAASRAREALGAVPGVAPERAALAGHSRGGKTALWAAAQDPGFCAVFASGSGCAGAALSRGKRGERVGDITARFPHWFCGNFRRWAGRETEMPFDQHMLLALAAPRPLYLSGAADDEWADPASEWKSARLAGEAYALYGFPGLTASEPPAPGGRDHGGQTGFHLRPGGHDLTAGDWAAFLDFLDEKSAARAPSRS